MTTEKRIEIAKEAVLNSNKKEVALKYKIGLSTIYKWINLYIKEDKNKQIYDFGLNFNKVEYDKFCFLLSKYGYETRKVKFIKKRIFDEKLMIVEPKEMLKELISLRSELNKLGGNINQIANYYNYLGSNKMVDESKIEDFFLLAKKIVKVQLELKFRINEIFNKEF